jgi:hypothetical protein
MFAVCAYYVIRIISNHRTRQRDSTSTAAMIPDGLHTMPPDLREASPADSAGSLFPASRPLQPSWTVETAFCLTEAHPTVRSKSLLLCGSARQVPRLLSASQGRWTGVLALPWRHQPSRGRHINLSIAGVIRQTPLLDTRCRTIGTGSGGLRILPRDWLHCTGGERRA